MAAERGGTTICCTRYGNVMCSRGSVIPLFIDQIKAGNPITITDPNMTRFLMNLDKIQKSDMLERLGLEKDKYILLSAHREKNIDSEKNFLSLFTAINAVAEKYDMPILYSYPRSKHRLEQSGFQLDLRVRVNEPLGFNDYNKLQMNALAIISDSGTLPEESNFYLSIGHPIAAVCIRTSTERPEALGAGNFILADITTRELRNATDMAIEMK